MQVSLPVSGEVTDYVDFPGRIEAVNSVEIRARVTGYLEKVYFQEGADVKQGDLLFEIDRRSYEAELARAEGAVIQSEGRLTRLNGDYERAQSLQAGDRAPLNDSHLRVGMQRLISITDRRYGMLEEAEQQALNNSHHQIYWQRSRIQHEARQLPKGK